MFIILFVALLCGVSANILYLGPNDICKDGPSVWRCQSLSNCPGLKEMRQKGIRPDICSFQGNEPIICCPLSTQSDTETTTTRLPKPTTQPATRRTTSKPYGGVTNKIDGEEGPVWGSWTARPSTNIKPTNPTKSKAEQKCKEYAEYVYRIQESPSLLPNQKPQIIKTKECGIETLIVGGNNSMPKEFPHMALIGYGDRPKIEWGCGGSLISPKFVLSAAHCTKPDSLGVATWVRLGELDRSINYDDADPIELRIRRRINHPQYNDRRLYHDISLFELEREVKLNTYIRPLCLHTSKEVNANSAIASGWGLTSWGGHESSMLQKVNLSIVTNKECNNHFGSDFKQQLPNGIVDNTMVCAGGEAGKDTCRGDSGGPLQIYHKNLFCMYSQIGVVSFGLACAISVPSVYTRVSNYVGWIENIKRAWTSQRRNWLHKSEADVTSLNDKCKNETESWTCQAVSTCKGLKKVVAKDGKMKLCGFQGREPFFCCPPEPLTDKVVPLSVAQPDGGKKAEQKCREYVKYVYREAMSPALILGSEKIDECAMNGRESLLSRSAIVGSYAIRDEFPHMVLIGVEREGKSSLWFCSGSWISPNFVLSAAHCFLTYKDSILVRILDTLESSDNANSVDRIGVDIKIAQVINHPMFIPTEAYHDISLLKLEKEVDLGPRIRPLCLQTDRKVDRAMAIVFGWDSTSYGKNSTTSSILQKAYLELLGEDMCVGTYRTHWSKVSKGIKPDLMLCTGAVHRKATCQRDSGGPLQIALEEPYCMFSQIGITSTGIGCGSKSPSVFTRVSAYVPWIENITNIQKLTQQTSSPAGWKVAGFSVSTSSGMLLVLLCSVVGGVFLSGASTHDLLFLDQGEKCKNETEPWTCKKASTCQSLKKGFATGGEMKLCGFQGREPIICCPPELLTDKAVPLPSAQPEAGKKAEQKCREYAEYVYREIDSPILLHNSKKKKIDECAITAETLIVGGTPAKHNEFPHMALIGNENKGNPVWFCGGSLISPNFVLTAAHCSISNVKDLVVVRLGELDLLEKKDKSNRIDVKITEVFNHPLYVPSKGYHDITLLKLEKEVELGPNIRPLCLQTNRSIKHDKAIASGWGYTTSGNDSVSSSILQKVLLNLTDDDKCVSAYGTDFDKVNQGINPDIMVCSGGVRGKDTCKGDSGGPLQVALKKPYCMYSQVGVTSFGINCGTTYPGVYTRVSAYVSWIENIVWP
nr:uncharacterized protein LOC106677624 [Halyomorpha halys]